MYLIKNYIINDVIFKIHNIDEIFYIKEVKNTNSLFKFSDSENLIIELLDLEKIQFYQEKIVLIDDVGKILKILKISDNNYFLSDIPKELLNIRITKNRNQFIYYFERTQPRKFGVTDLENKIFETSIPNFYWIFLKENIFYFIDQLVTCYSNENSFCWEYDLSKLDSQSATRTPDKFYTFLGIAYDKLFILSEQNKIIVLNIIDGSFVKLIYSEEFSSLTDSFMHPENFNIYCLSDTFVKINSETLEIETLKKITKEKISPEINTVLYGIKDSSYQGKYISFTSYTSFRSGKAKWIGLFDYDMEEIVWHHELLPEENQSSIPAFESPQLAGNKLFVLDSEKMLHILELNKDLLR